VTDGPSKGVSGFVPKISVKLNFRKTGASQPGRCFVMDGRKKKALLMIPLRPLRSGRGTRRQIDRSDSELGHSDSLRAALVVVGIKKDSGSHQMVKDSKKFALSFWRPGREGLRLRTSNTSNRKMENSASSRTKTARTDARSSAMRPPRWNVSGRFYELGDHSTVVGK